MSQVSCGRAALGMFSASRFSWMQSPASWKVWPTKQWGGCRSFANLPNPRSRDAHRELTLAHLEHADPEYLDTTRRTSHAAIATNRTGYFGQWQGRWPGARSPPPAA